MGHVRPLAQILEGVLGIGADDQILDGPLLVLDVITVFVELPPQQSVDDLQLVGLILEQFARFLGRHDLVAQGVLAGDDLAHALLDAFQIALRESAAAAGLVLAQVKVVIEPIVDGRADADLGLGK